MSTTSLGLTGSANAITINNTNGNVGIGTTTPATALQVAGTVTATGYAGLPVATTSAPGVVQVGSGLSVSSGVVSVATTNEVGVLYALPSTGQGYVPYRFTKSSSAVGPNLLYFSYADTDQSTNNYTIFTCPSSISQQQNWHGFVGYYSATAGQHINTTISIYTGSSGSAGTKVFEGSYAQYITLSSTAAHLPVAFTTKLSYGNYSIYLGLLASPTANVTLFHDTGHSQYLTFTPI